MGEGGKIRIVQSKCMADMFVWLGFEYVKTEDGYVFQRDILFESAWHDVHYLKDSLKVLRKIREEKIK